MIAGGHATVMVADMDRAVAVYTRVLGLELLTRSGSDWAEVTTSGLTIGLHLAGHGVAARHARLHLDRARRRPADRAGHGDAMPARRALPRPGGRRWGGEACRLRRSGRQRAVPLRGRARMSAAAVRRYDEERWNRWRLDRTDALLRDLGGAA